MGDIAIIGAGIAGLTAARQLKQAGYRVQILEKSRGLGGRLATRRVDGQPVDHGCRFIEPFHIDSLNVMPALLSTNILCPWQPSIFELDPNGNLRTSVEADIYYVAPLGMTGIAKFLADGLAINRQRRVTCLRYGQGGWQIQSESPQGVTETIEAKAVIAAIPAPQLSPLLGQALGKHTFNRLVQQLDRVTFDPVITVMAEYGAIAENPFPSTLTVTTDRSHSGWMVFGQNHPHIRWVGLDSSKRQSPAKAIVVIHSTPTFAQNYLDIEATAAGQALVEATAAVLGPWLNTPNRQQTHRWRYGFVRQPLQEPCLVSEHLPCFVICGDWCLGSNVEAAFRSGQKAAEELIRQLT